MNFDFEEYLRRQSIRPIPSEWRKEILRAARDGVAQTSKSAVSRVSKPAGRNAVEPTWKSAIRQVWKPALHEWLWPCPRAWAALAAAWGIILLLNVTAPEETAATGQVASASRQDFAFLRQETEIIARLSEFEENRVAPAPRPAALKPRSSRHVKQCIG
jgi:hypothetical protein